MRQSHCHILSHDMLHHCLSSNNSLENEQQQRGGTHSTMQKCEECAADSSRVHYFKSDYIIQLIAFQWNSLVCMVHQTIPFLWRWVWLIRMTPPLFPVTVGNCLFPSVHLFINFVPRPAPHFICIYNYTRVTAFLFCGNYCRTGFNCVV